MNVDKEQAKHVLIVADMIIEHTEIGGDKIWGLDSKRPFGFSGGGGAFEVLEAIGAKPDGHDGEWSHEQVDYAHTLMGEAGAQIKKLWKKIRANWEPEDDDNVDPDFVDEGPESQCHMCGDMEYTKYLFDSGPPVGLMCRGCQHDVLSWGDDDAKHG